MINKSVSQLSLGIQ